MPVITSRNAGFDWEADLYRIGRVRRRLRGSGVPPAAAHVLVGLVEGLSQSAIAADRCCSRARIHGLVVRLAEAGLLVKGGRGVWCVTENGLAVAQ